MISVGNPSIDFLRAKVTISLNVRTFLAKTENLTWNASWVSHFRLFLPRCYFFHYCWLIWLLHSKEQQYGSDFRLPAQSTRWLDTAPCWIITQRVVVISYRHFGTTYRFHLAGSTTIIIIIVVVITMYWNCIHYLNKIYNPKNTAFRSLVLPLFQGKRTEAYFIW
jgi:hypothetical protein